MPFKDAIPLAGSVQPIAEEYNQFLFNTAYNPLYPFERGSNCAEHAINRSNMCLHFLHFHKGTVHNSRQKAGLFSRCMIFQIFSKKKLVQDTAVFSGSAFLNAQLRFRAQNVLFPCKCVISFQQGSAFKAKYR